MVDAALILLGVSLILFFGFFAEFVFKKFGIPDILFLIFLGFIIGPYVLKYVYPSQLETYAPVFTTFALLFLLYDGAFNIDLASFARGVTKSLSLTLFNFFISTVIISAIMFLFRYSFMTSLLTGFILGGISSAFVIPLIKQLKIKDETYSVLALESAMTDVFSIVFALTVIEVIKLNSFSFSVTASKIAALFAVAGLIGIVAGIIWIVLSIKVFREHKSYMITVAYLILVYVVTELLNGNGAIAALFFGLVLRNSKQLTSIFNTIVNKKRVEQAEADKEGTKNSSYGISVTSINEKFFYSQISFFLKTFFFVYIGILIDLSNLRILVIGLIISLSIMLSRKLSDVLTKSYSEFDRRIIKSIFGRGLAAAAIAQIVIINNIEHSLAIRNITYAVISFTIILSSVTVFMAKRPIKIVPS